MSIQRQKPVKGGRVPANACVIRDLRKIVERTAREFQVSKSFVIAVALSKAFDVPIEGYEVVETRRQLRRVK